MLIICWFTKNANDIIISWKKTGWERRGNSRQTWSFHRSTNSRKLGYVGSDAHLRRTICCCKHILKLETGLYFLSQPIPRAITGIQMCYPYRIWWNECNSLFQRKSKNQLITFLSILGVTQPDGHGYTQVYLSFCTRTICIFLW